MSVKKKTKTIKKTTKATPKTEAKTGKKLFAFEVKEFNVVNGKYLPSVVIHHESEESPFSSVSVARRPELDLEAV